MPIDIKDDDIDTALQKLKAREDTLKQLEEVSKIGSWESDLVSGLSIWSGQNYTIYGIAPQTPVSVDVFFSVLLPEYLEKAKELLSQAIRSGEVTTFTCKARHSSGKVLNLILNAKVIYDNDKTPLKIVGTTQDITEQTSIKEHATELSELIEYSSNEVYIIDKESLQYLYVNKGACNALGYTQKELVSKNVYDVNPYLTPETTKELIQELEKTTHSLNKTVHKRKDGTIYHVQSYIHDFKYKGRDVYVIFDIDITSAIELELQYEKQAKVLEYIHDSVISTDTQGNIMSWNRGSTSLFAYEERSMIGENISKIYNVDNKYTLTELFEILQKNGNIDTEAYMRTKDDKIILCDIALSISKNSRGELD